MSSISRFEQLVEVAKYGTISEAAEMLHISQPTLSRSMKKLEEELGVELFVHSKNKVVLTDTGKLAVQQCQDFLHQFDSMVEHIRMYDRQSRSLCLGVITPLLLWTIVPLLSARNPGMMLHTAVQTEDMLLGGLNSHQFSFIVTTKPTHSPTLTCRELGQDWLYYYVPKNHRLARRSSVTMEDINGESLIIHPDLTMWYPVFKYHLPDSRLIVHEDGDAYRDLLRASNIPAFTTRTTMMVHPPRPDRIPLPVVGDDTHVTYYFICAKNKFGALEGGYTALYTRFNE